MSHERSHRVYHKNLAESGYCVDCRELEHKSYYWVKLDENGFWQPARWVKSFDTGHWELIGEDYWRDAGDVHEVGTEITYNAD